MKNTKILLERFSKSLKINHCKSAKFLNKKLINLTTLNLNVKHSNATSSFFFLKKIPDSCLAPNVPINRCQHATE